jgi:lipopolysaccharide/colanic/teichoic acid biosynthesis glycosyltransferase
MATITTGLCTPSDSWVFADSGTTTFYQNRGKRLFDLAVSLAALIVLSPLLLVCALVVRLTSCGPILFRQTRVGYRGQPFSLCKFRTMFAGAEALGTALALQGDLRLTSVGAFLRRTKLDELPQLVNVLTGEMSLVGPRPRVPSEVDLNDPEVRRLLMVRPGLTSPASIHHRWEADYCAALPNPQAVHRTKLLPQKLSLDGEYMQKLTFAGDLKLLTLTALLVVAPGYWPAAGRRGGSQEPWPLGKTRQLAFELAIYLGAVWLAYHLRYENRFPEFYRRQMSLLLILLPPLRVLVNRWLGVYDLMWRYVNLVDAYFLASSLAPLTVAMFLLRLWLPVTSQQKVLCHVPLSVAALEYLIGLSVGVGVRSLGQRLYLLQRHYQPLPEALHRVLILGAGLVGLRAALDMRRYPHMKLVGFLDDDPSKEGKLLAGHRVLGNSAQLASLGLRYGVSDLIVCAQSLAPDRMTRLERQCSTLKIRLRWLASLDILLRDEMPAPRPAGIDPAFAGATLPLNVPTLPGRPAWPQVGRENRLPLAPPARTEPPAPLGS